MDRSPEITWEGTLQLLVDGEVVFEAPATRYLKTFVRPSIEAGFPEGTGIGYVVGYRFEDLPQEEMDRGRNLIESGVEERFTPQE